MQQNPNTTKADVISKIVANRDAIRQRARQTLLAFVGSLQGSVLPGAEKWEENLFEN
jgi:hypothetical protein